MSAFLTIHLSVTLVAIILFATATTYLLRLPRRTVLDRLYLASAIVAMLNFVGLSVWWVQGEVYDRGFPEPGDPSHPWITIVGLLTVCSYLTLPVLLDFQWRQIESPISPGFFALLVRAIYLPAIGFVLFVWIAHGWSLMGASFPTDLVAGAAILVTALYLIPILLAQIMIVRQAATRPHRPRERAYTVWMMGLLGGASVYWFFGYGRGIADFFDPRSWVPLGFVVFWVVGLMVTGYYHYRYIFMDRLLKRGTVILFLIVFAIVFQQIILSRLVWEIRLANRAIGEIVLLIALILFAAVFMRTHRLVGEVIDRWILRRRNYRHDLLRLNRLIAEQPDRASLLRQVQSLIQESLQVREISFEEARENASPISPTVHVHQPSGFDTDEPIEVIVPIASRNRLFGQIRGRDRRNDAPFFTAEVEFLEAAGSALGAALEMIELHEAEQQRQLQAERLKDLAIKAELRALQAQINPHFLFNTLNVVAGLVRTNPEQAEEMIENLADIFRYALDGSRRESVRLSDEIEFIRTYLEIERKRFEDRLRIEFDIDDELEPIRIPAMILQPLVENAIRHGVTPKVGPAVVSVSVRRQAQCIRVEVMDDGVGFDGKLSGSGTGIRNVDQRLRSFFGDQAKLRIESQPGNGTRVTFDLPIVS